MRVLLVSSQLLIAKFMIINTDLIYPIGSIYLSVNATNPSKYFGGTWQQITSDAYLKIVSSNAGSLGGTSAEHKIPIASIPAHNHDITVKAAWGGASSPNVEYYNINTTYGTQWSNRSWINYSSNKGGGQAYYPYYYGVYVWKRVA